MANPAMPRLMLTLAIWLWAAVERGPRVAEFSIAPSVTSEFTSTTVLSTVPFAAGATACRRAA